MLINPQQKQFRINKWLCKMNKIDSVQSHFRMYTETGGSMAESIDLTGMNIPNHIAIIMDGNGRWAKKRFLPRNAGHVAGAKTVEKNNRRRI